MRTLLLAPVAALTLAAGPGAPPGVVRPVADVRRDAVDDAVERGLEHLARSQTRGGGWTMGGGAFGGRNPWGGMAAAEGDIAITSLAVMAFLSAGHVPGEGKYGEVVERGIRWVLQQHQQDGRLAPKNGMGLEMYHHGIASLMLAEAVGMTAGELAEPLRQGLEAAVRVILVGQRQGDGPFGRSHAGGWRYQAVVGGGFGGDADLSVTGWQLMALRAAKNVGCDVPASRIQAAVGYVKRSVDPRTGGFQYQPGGNVTTPCTGVGVLCLELSGKEYHLCDEALRGGAYLLNTPMRAGDGHFYYGVYYVSQALFQLGGNYWLAYRPKLHDLLLRQAGPNQDGAWGGRGGDSGYGSAYCTAMAVLALTVEYRFLPIYQRFEEPLERDGRE
jgi:hypothetical protein